MCFFRSYIASFFPFASFFKDRTMFATCISSPLLQSKAPYTFTIFCLFTSLVMNIFDSNSATITNVTCSSNVPLSNCVRDPPGIYLRDRLAGLLVIPLRFSLSTARLLFKMTVLVLFPHFG